ncbi:hypothetical protein WICPIJ_000071 [Wickerhamomyces pijperi]|uniref:Uncharacterized protein n=1 Tax=Wickerhamomyces pijperi TaxID=599730 RepID=A0A9P8QDH4_WICPI|nr:hypothetical protein WICPIJ_000071 [Wickerhamomyces pijperi]
MLAWTGFQHIEEISTSDLWMKTSFIVLKSNTRMERSLEIVDNKLDPNCGWKRDLEIVCLKPCKVDTDWPVLGSQSLTKLSFDPETISP